MVSTILVCLLAAAFSGGSGYSLSRRFWSSRLSMTATRSALLVTMSGAILGVIAFGGLGPYILPASTIAPAVLTALLSGMVGGYIGLWHGDPPPPTTGKGTDWPKRVS